MDSKARYTLATKSTVAKTRFVADIFDFVADLSTVSRSTLSLKLNMFNSVDERGLFLSPECRTSFQLRRQCVPNLRKQKGMFLRTRCIQMNVTLRSAVKHRFPRSAEVDVTAHFDNVWEERRVARLTGVHATYWISLCNSYTASKNWDNFSIARSFNAIAAIDISVKCC